MHKKTHKFFFRIAASTFSDIRRYRDNSSTHLIRQRISFLSR